MLTSSIDPLIKPNDIDIWLRCGVIDETIVGGWGSSRWN